MTPEMTEELRMLMRGGAPEPPSDQWNNVSPAWRAQTRARYQA